MILIKLTITDNIGNLVIGNTDTTVFISVFHDTALSYNDCNEENTTFHNLKKWTVKMDCMNYTKFPNIKPLTVQKK